MTPAELLKNEKEMIRMLNLLRRAHDLKLDRGEIFTGKALIKALADLHDAIGTWHF